MNRFYHRLFSWIGLLSLVVGLFAIPAPVQAITTATLVGSLQTEVGCANNWDPGCTQSRFSYDADDDVWQVSWSMLPGNFEYKVAIDGSWDENYGAGGVLNGSNITLNLTQPGAVKFYYDHKSHWITSSRNSVIATLPGSFQSELGCPGDWQPDCLRSWLQDVDGDGIYTFSTSSLPAGNYETKVAIDEQWGTNYGAGGELNGANIAFSVSATDRMVNFSFDSVTHVLSIQVIPDVTTVTLVGNLQSELGCTSDWEPACAATYLPYDADDDVYQHSWTVPAGSWEYKAALNDGWVDNYGANGAANGSNIPLNLATPEDVKFYYDHKTHWITSSKTSVIATVPGSFQSELGCPGDWQPDCLRSWLQDVDGDGSYTFETTALPAGSYEAKVTINEGWNENYGQGGAPNGANIPFEVVYNNALVTFRYDAASHVLTIETDTGQSELDNNVEWDGLRHDSRDLLYRTPGGAVTAGTDVRLRLRTFHNDVSGVNLRLYDINVSAQVIRPMSLAASGVSCYQPGLEDKLCDFWEAVVTNPEPNLKWYRFIVTDGTDTDYYADNTAALDGGLGEVTDEPVDRSWVLTVYDPAFQTPEWAKGALIYQIFPDRFRNGNPANDPQTGDHRYDDPVLALDWGTKPEGYCRNYADANGDTCPWRYDDTPPAWSPEKEGPRGRDYFGGDLQGIIDKLPYLRAMGVDAIYLNPIFMSQSNHGYDTSNYRMIDPNLGTLKDFRTLVNWARKYKIRIILDGVYNHMSSDSPLFDRYSYFPEVGACESGASQWRGWFTFFSQAGGPCAPSAPSGTATNYNGWFGFDSIPVIDKINPAVQSFFLTQHQSVTKYWLKYGMAGWRMDVMGDSSFPDGYWETFRQVVKSQYPDVIIIGELWQKDSTLLGHLIGDRADTSMNYRLRDAVIGLLTPQASFDSKGFADSGRPITPTEFAERVLSIQEDTPAPAYYTMMNLLDSHDTERLLWSLTPGSETTADKELNAANVAIGKANQRLAALIQFTMPGAPTVYYGDEVGITGDDDPDDRRTYPWSDTGGQPDLNLLNFYRHMAGVQNLQSELISGDLKFLVTDDANDTLAYARTGPNDFLVVAINMSAEPKPVVIPVGDYLRELNGAEIFMDGYFKTWDGPGLWLPVVDGFVTVELPARSGVVLVQSPDLQPTAAPANLRVTAEASQSVSLAWDAVAGATGYNVYRSPLSGGGFVKLNDLPLAGLTFTDTSADLQNATRYYYVVRALDDHLNESANSNEVRAMPRLTIGWANLQWPPTLSHTISVVNRTDNVYGQVWIDGVTNQPGLIPSLRAQLGFGPTGSNPDANSAWIWVDAAFNVDAGNNDEFVASLLPEAVGAYDYAYRYTTTGGAEWVYADLDGTGNGYSPDSAGKLTVNPSADTQAPAAPLDLQVVAASPGGVELAWSPIVGDASLYGYEVLRSDTAGGPYSLLDRVTAAAYTDHAVVENATYFYVVRALDLSFNRSDYSNEVSATAELREVTVTFNVTVPATTDATGFSVYIAGTLSRLNGSLPDWNPGGEVLTRVDATHWTITVTGFETNQIEYKYALGSWEFVEKDTGCGEVANRQLTLSYGDTGTQTVNDTVLNWRNVAPCGN